MSVYVDVMEVSGPNRRGFAAHMLADTHDELMEMAGLIGLRPEWIQRAGTVYEHFDLSPSKRSLAIHHGARIAGPHEIVSIIANKRKAVPA